MYCTVGSIICLIVGIAGGRDLALYTIKRLEKTCPMFVLANSDGSPVDDKWHTKYFIDEADNRCAFCLESLIEVGPDELFEHSILDSAEYMNCTFTSLELSPNCKLLIKCPRFSKHLFHPECFAKYYAANRKVSSSLPCPMCRCPCANEFGAYVTNVFKDYYSVSNEFADNSQKFFSIIFTQMPTKRLEECFESSLYNIGQLNKLAKIFEMHRGVFKETGQTVNSIKSQIKQNKKTIRRTLRDIFGLNPKRSLNQWNVPKSKKSLGLFISQLRLDNVVYDQQIREPSIGVALSPLDRKKYLENMPMSLSTFILYIASFTDMSFTDSQIGRLIKLCFKMNYDVEGLTLMDYVFNAYAEPSEVFKHLSSSRIASKLCSWGQHANWTMKEVIVLANSLLSAQQHGIIGDVFGALQLDDADIFELICLFHSNGQAYLACALLQAKQLARPTIDQAIGLLKTIVDLGHTPGFSVSSYGLEDASISEELLLEPSRYIDILKACFYQNKDEDGNVLSQEFDHQHICAHNILLIILPYAYDPDIACIRLIIQVYLTCPIPEKKKSILNHIADYLKYSNSGDTKALWRIIIDGGDIPLLIEFCKRHSKSQIDNLDSTDILRLLAHADDISAINGLLTVLINKQYIVPKTALSYLTASKVYTQSSYLGPAIKLVYNMGQIGDDHGVYVKEMCEWLAHRNMHAYIGFLIYDIKDASFFYNFTNLQVRSIVCEFINWHIEEREAMTSSTDELLLPDLLSVLLDNKLPMHHLGTALTCFYQYQWPNHTTMLARIYFKRICGMGLHYKVAVKDLCDAFLYYRSSFRAFTFFYANCPFETVKNEMSNQIVRNIVENVNDRIRSIPRMMIHLRSSDARVHSIAEALMARKSPIIHLQQAKQANIIKAICEKQIPCLSELLTSAEYQKLAEHLKSEWLHSSTLIPGSNLIRTS